MLKAILFDCGGVFVYPTHGDWLLAPGFTEILGEDFAREHLPTFRSTRARFQHLLPDTNRIDSDQAEHAMFVDYYASVFAEMGISLSADQLDRLAWLQTYRDDRYVFFDDVLPYLEKWHGKYKLGIVSDAPPSTRRIMKTYGVMEHIAFATFSCDLGVLKPDARIYASTLDALGVAPGEAVFIDDLTHNLHGAQAIGLRAVQMRRPMPEEFSGFRCWDGPVVHSFGEFDTLLQREFESARP